MSTIHPVTPNTLADRVAEVAYRLERAGISTDRIELTTYAVAIQLDNEAEVDRAATLFTDTEADNGGQFYTRTGFLDSVVTVRLHSLRSGVRCGCGAACGHAA